MNNEYGKRVIKMSEVYVNLNQVLMNPENRIRAQGLFTKVVLSLVQHCLPSQNNARSCLIINYSPKKSSIKCSFMKRLERWVH